MVDETNEQAVEDFISVLEKKPSLKERLLALVGYREQARDAPLTQGFKALGNGKWIGVWSNNFEDREGEYFPNHATDAYIARLDSKETPMPELVFWHTHYAYGQAKSVARIAAGDAPDAPSLSIAVGEFYKDDISKAFEQATLKSQKNYKMSHGYLYPDDALIDGVYHYYDTFEISVLPDYAAANPYTLFGDEKMPAVTPEKQKELEALLGKEYAAEVVTKAEQRAKELAEKGIGYKDKTIPTVDSEARQGISEVKSAVTDLTTSIKELVTELKAAKKPADDDEEDKDGKMDKLFGGKKKELDDAIAAAKAATAALEAKQKEFNELTPRQASKDKSTEIGADDSLIAQQIAANQAQTEAKKEFSQLFGGIFPSANGAGS